MGQYERHKIIVDIVQQQQNVPINTLIELLNVSDETIRRDLIALEKKGQLRRVRGGAVYESPTTNAYDISDRIKKKQREKEEICREAAKLVQDGESIAIASSTTAMAMGKYLAQKTDLTVVTNSIFLANQMSSNQSNHVILTGGTLWNEEQHLMGTLTKLSFSQYRVDKAFISVSGITPDDGLTEYTEEEAELLKTVIKYSKSTILLLDYSKFNVIAFHKIADWDEIKEVVTDSNASKKDVEAYERMGIRVHRAQRQ
ncbi:DeoR/GlpR family DNA-binding transcription regulator [Ruminococcaceae bacterium OttesenSCG-928-I18]|nr:DeoR/GlpR family DNA-binding transcription regulator [Ruminococcaceae bacterium OttesenSCG-928-I18]